MLDPRNIQTVVFDLDDTLRYSVPDGNAFFVEQARALGLDISPEAQRNARRWVHQYWATSDELLADIQAHEVYDDDFWVTYGRRHLLALGYREQEAERYAPELHQLMKEHYQPEDRLMEGARNTIARLQAGGYQVGLLTNRSRPIYDVMHKLELDLDLDFFLAAAQLGAYKPERAIFDGMLELLGLDAAQVAYVGDNYYADILGARDAGIAPVLMDPTGLYPEAKVPTITAIPQILELLQVEQPA